jgi:hypothetical protein
MFAALTLAFGLDTAAVLTAPVPKAEILGLWKGHSICAKIKEAEFCHDEVVAYNFVDLPEQPTTVSLKAAKIWDGTLRPTYAIYFNYIPEEHRWTSGFSRGSTHGLWSYVIKGDELTGTLVLLPERTVVRNVTAKRVAREQVLAP